VRWSGRLLQKLPLFSLLGKTRQKSMARGNGLESRDERLVVSPQRPLPMPGGWQAPLPSRGQPVVERSASRERLYESVPSTWPTRRIVSHVRGSEQCLDPGAKGNRARRGSRVRRLLPAPASVERKPVRLGPIRLSWMWQVEHFAAPGRPIGASNMLRSFPWFRRSREILPPPRPPRAVRSHRRWRGPDRLACNAGLGPPQLRISVAGVPACLTKKLFQYGAISL
jgi:hypothetical protein